MASTVSTKVMVPSKSQEIEICIGFGTEDAPFRY